jgi:hypothetical protein
MVVIFGFGPGNPDDQGEVAPCVCPNCHNQVFLHHVRSKKSVRLYFVPVAPYGTDDYLVCPVCSRGLQVNGVQLRQVRSMSAATASFRAGRLPQVAENMAGRHAAARRLLAEAAAATDGLDYPSGPIAVLQARAFSGFAEADLDTVRSASAEALRRAEQTRPRPRPQPARLPGPGSA